MVEPWTILLFVFKTIKFKEYANHKFSKNIYYKRFPKDSAIEYK